MRRLRTTIIVYRKIKECTNWINPCVYWKKCPSPALVSVIAACHVACLTQHSRILIVGVYWVKDLIPSRVSATKVSRPMSHSVALCVCMEPMAIGPASIMNGLSSQKTFIKYAAPLGLKSNFIIQHLPTYRPSGANNHSIPSRVSHFSKAMSGPAVFSTKKFNGRTRRAMEK